MKLAALVVSALCLGRAAAQEPCMTTTNTFTVKIDLFAGELGYYSFEECPGLINPTLGMEIGETYTFLQADRSNYYHPMGFSYFPDGAHASLDELEPGITQTAGNDCAASLNCSAPMYFSGDAYLGVYSNIPELVAATTGEEDFGLDVYEPLFFRSPPEWVGFDQFNVKLRFTDEDYDQDIFYFCHIHQFMSGRIKLLKNGVKVSELDKPLLGYDYDAPGDDFDRECGTFNLEDFRLPNDFCPDRFVCDTDGASPQLQKFSTCIDAMNCHMLAGMTTKVSAGSEVALFIHQMIPHHQNAVNMAKTLLKAGALTCADLADDEDPDCVMEVILREIINGQNFQIQAMRGVLESSTYPDSDNCDVRINTETDMPDDDGGGGSGASSVNAAALLGLGGLLLAV